MSHRMSPPPARWTRSRYGFAAFCFLSLLFCWSVLRMVLLFAFPPATPTIAGVARALASGLPRDLFAGLLQTIPLLLWLLMIPDKKFSARWHRVSLIAVSFIAAFVQI